MTAVHRHRAPAKSSRALIVTVLVLVVAAAVGGGVALYVRGAHSNAPSAISAANDKAAESDVRTAVSSIEQCYADNMRYPSAVDASGSIAGCSSTRVNLSPGDAISYFASAGGAGYILAVHSESTGQSGGGYCYASTAGTVVKISQPLTGWRSSC